MAQHGITARSLDLARNEPNGLSMRSDDAPIVVTDVHVGDDYFAELTRPALHVTGARIDLDLSGLTVDPRDDCGPLVEVYGGSIQARIHDSELAIQPGYIAVTPEYYVDAGTASSVVFEDMVFTHDGRPSTWVPFGCPSVQASTGGSPVAAVPRLPALASDLDGLRSLAPYLA